MGDIGIRRARPEDVDAISESYELTHDDEEAGRAIIGWVRGVYPVRATAERAVAADQMWVMEDADQFVASAIINHTQVPEYADAMWSNDASGDEVLVLHTLVVRPGRGGHGYGTAFVRFYEDRARELGCTALRMDTNEKNAAARRLYAHLGFKEVDIVPCVFNGIPNVQLVCLEKLL